MLEDLTMEKKTSIRTSQNTTKTSGTEIKKPPDVTSKSFPKSSRRRESPNSNGYRPDQARKPALQKTKSFDKRPRARGQYYGSGKESAQVEECEDDVGSLYSSGSKKYNLNHLLNFHYAPRGETAQRAPKPSYQYGVRWLMSTHKHKYNKEHFLQANCQFVVKADADYNPYLADPDHLVNWELIEQVIVSSVEPVSCPICLSAPVAAKMTRCGHIYCCPCILHYLALSDKTWRKCPICFESVHKKDLKSVKVDSKVSKKVGQPITFQLMTREHGSLMACPVSQFHIRTTEKPILNVSEKHLDTAFAKLLAADKSEVMSIIAQEIKELKTVKAENLGCPELCFIEQALEMCDERCHSVEQENVISEPAIDYSETTDTNKNINLEQGSIQEIIENKSNRSGGRQSNESLSSEGDEPGPTNITAGDLEAFSHQPASQNKQFFFYQASDGQQIYLHAMNVQMLEMTYGSLRTSPVELTGVVLEKEAGSMTAELRNRLRYLQHLPVTSQFEVVEIQLLPPDVTQDTVNAFKDEIDKRKKRRIKRARDERKREKKIAEVELRQMGRHATPRLSLDSFQHFPQCGIAEDEILPLAPRVVSTESSRASSPGSRRSVSPSIAALALEQDSSPSFAQMLRNSKLAGGRGPAGWRSSQDGLRPASPPDHWGASAQLVNSDGETTSAPGYHQSISTAIAIALEKASIQSDKNDSQNGKKKKKKQKVLFSTGMVCTSK